MSNSKTPQFDKSLEEILTNLKPHQKTCKQCQGVFNIFQEDIEFYKKLRVPPPKLCPECRKQRRFGFYNNMLKFYRKEDTQTGEKIISTFHPESTYKIYDLKHWWSDKWDPLSYGGDYDFSKPFFQQFQELNLSVPHPPLINLHYIVVNSPYTISTANAKNCFFVSLGGSIENVHYSCWTLSSRDSLDLLNSSLCENCYYCINCLRCYKCSFCENSQGCLDSYFLYDCRNCSNCFGCTNLRNKQYYFFNQPFTKKEYQMKVKEINLGKRDVLEQYKERFGRLLRDAKRRNLENDKKNINCFGNQLFQSKNCYLVFRSTGAEIIGLGKGRGNENVRYSDDVGEVKDSLELYIAGPDVFLSYEIVEVFKSHNIKFSFFISNSMDLEYCLSCRNCKYCFGCISLRNKSYCILNKQYSKENYYQLLDKIKTKMLKDEKYGEFFPLSMSLHPYNDTYAMIEFPLTKEEVLKKGWQWYDEPKVPPDLMGLEIIDGKDVPKDIKDVSDDILNKAIVCEITGKPFRIIKSELDFYRKHNLPIPTKHPYQRMLERFQKRNPSKLWQATCAKCGELTYTSYPPEKQKELKIYCEECYLKEVV